MHDRVVKAASAALTVPLSPAPGKSLSPSAVYRYYPGRGDGALRTARFEVRVFHRSPDAAAAEISALQRALLADGDTGVVGIGADSLVICGTKEGGRGGYVRGCGLYYLQAGFEIQGRCGE